MYQCISKLDLRPDHFNNLTAILLQGELPPRVLLPRLSVVHFPAVQPASGASVTYCVMAASPANDDTDRCMLQNPEHYSIRLIFNLQRAVTQLPHPSPSPSQIKLGPQIIAKPLTITNPRVAIIIIIVIINIDHDAWLLPVSNRAPPPHRRSHVLCASLPNPTQQIALHPQRPFPCTSNPVLSQRAGRPGSTASPEDNPMIIRTANGTPDGSHAHNQQDDADTRPPAAPRYPTDPVPAQRRRSTAYGFPRTHRQNRCARLRHERAAETTVRVWKDEDRRDRGCARFVGGGACACPPATLHVAVARRGYEARGERMEVPQRCEMAGGAQVAMMVSKGDNEEV